MCPIYLHPDESPAAVVDAYYAQFPALLGPGWAYTVETATQALRLMLSGMFDAHPRLKIILGHLGESLPFSIVRCAANINRRISLKRPLQDYFHENFWFDYGCQFDYWRRGLFAFDRLIKYDPFDEIEHAFADAQRGIAIKPVLVMEDA